MGAGSMPVMVAGPPVHFAPTRPPPVAPGLVLLLTQRRGSPFLSWGVFPRRIVRGGEHFAPVDGVECGPDGWWWMVCRPITPTDTVS